MGRGNDITKPSAAAAFAPSELAMRASPFRMDEPESLTSGVVFSSPHSGRAYFRELLDATALDPLQLRASEDAYVDQLFAGAVGCGAPLLAAIAPRAFIDLNRGPSDLDPHLVEGAAARASNARVVAGLGVVPRIVAEGVPIYRRKISMEEARWRIAHWHAPYHQQLMALLLRARRRFGHAVLIDCHSMPSLAPHIRTRRGGGQAEIVLGDRFGASASPAVMDAVEAAFIASGFRVARNAPFAGGYITERYGRPAAGVSAVQIEIDRALYLDEAQVAPSADYPAFQDALAPVVRRLSGIVGSSEGSAAALAAE